MAEKAISVWYAMRSQMISAIGTWLLNGSVPMVFHVLSGQKVNSININVLVLNAQSTEPAFSPDLKSVSRREPMGIDTSVVRHKYSSRVSLFRGDARN